MGKELAKTPGGICPLNIKDSFVLIAFLVTFAGILGTGLAHAAIGTTTQNWPATPIYSNAAYPAAGISYNAVAGSDRLLVVGVSSSTTAVAQAQPTVTYGGVSMTAAVGYSATATQQHSYLFYLPLGTSATADTGKTIVVSISGGTSRYCIVNAAVYTGVNQAAPVGTSVRSSNNTTTSTAVGPFTLAETSGELGVSVLNTVRSGTTRVNATTITIGTTGHVWSAVSTAASGRIIGSLRTTFATTLNTNTATATQHTSSAASLNSTAAMIIKPLQGITLGNGSTLAGNKSVYVGDANAINVVVDAFTLVADTATNVTGITFTGNTNTTAAVVGAIKIWRKVGTNLTAYEAGDVLVASGSANGGAVTMSMQANEPVSATVTNYIVTYDIASGAAASTANQLTGTITAITPAALSLTDTTAFSASLYIYPTTTVGNGTEPPAVRLWKGSAATRLDAFTLAHNSSTTADDDSITTMTVTMTPQYISGGSGSTSSKIKLLEVVSADGLTVYGSKNAAISGDVWDIPTTSLKATVSPATYYLRITTADTITPSIADTSGTPEGYYTFSGRVTGLIHGNSNSKLVLNDTAGQTLSIDVEKPVGPATATAATGANAGEISLVWDAASDNNSGSLDATTPFLVRRSLPDGTQPSPGCVDGTAIPLSPANLSSRSFTDTGLVDTVSTRYYYRVCAKDTQGNISDGAATYANAKMTNVCTNPPTLSLTAEDGLSNTQLIKSANSAPFKLQIANNDIGICPNIDFTVVLSNEVNSAHFDKNLAGGSFPSTVTLGTGGSSASTGKTLNIYITGRPEASQLEQYAFAITVSSAGNSHGAPQTTQQVTGVLNDMPPIVHNSNNMAKYQYGNWGQTFTCATCHSNSTTNIKGIYQVISTSIGRRKVVFSKTSSVETDYNGVFGNDKRTINNVSNNVCSVCHHHTRQHQYSASKALLNNGQAGVVGPNSDEVYNTDHHNSRDCVRCHTHNTAFRSIYGLCGDCHGFKATGYSPVSKSTMVKDLTNALGPSPPNYGAHLRHNTARLGCGACHNNTNHGLATTAWQGDNRLEIGFFLSKDTFTGFNPDKTITGGNFYGTNNLNSPFTWSVGPGTTLVPITDYNASCNTYCHGQWSGNAGNNTTPIWIGSGQAVCGSCHNATGAVPPASGSHTKHAANFGAGLGIACSKCHATYTSYTGSAHINGMVEWNLSAYPGALYNGANAGSTNSPAPSAGYANCTNLYCHSNVQGSNGTGGPTTFATAKWGDSSTAACGSCHTVPNTSGSHQNHENLVVAFDCHVCHNNGGTTSPLNHANGTVDFQFVGLGQNTVYSLGNSVPVGSSYGTCSASNCHGRFTRAWGTAMTGLPLCEKCHGSATSPRGFYNTRGPDGTLSIYSAAIGVHDIHLQNPNSPRKASFNRFTSFAKGQSCRQCHTVPQDPFSPGHIDTALPAEVPFSHLSSIANVGRTKFSYYTSPSYSFVDNTCSAVWCHGAGMNSNNSTGPYVGVAPAIQRQNPKWDTPFLTGNGATDCVKCHALPPPAPDPSYIHYGQTLTTCKDCHVHVSNDGLGFKDKSLHINGKIDGGCTNCHGYPPRTNVIGAADGLATPAQGALRSGTAGAHGAHALNANIGKNCQVCHYSYTAVMPSNSLELGFNAFNGTVTSGTYTGYSNSGIRPNWVSRNAGTVIQKVTTGANVCSNLYCHGGGTATLPVLGGGSNTTPNWEGGSTDATCGSCHGTDTTNVPTGGSHIKHASSVNGGLGLLCATCHKTVTDMSHVDGSVSWSLDHDNPAVGSIATYYNLSSGKIVGLAPRNNGTDYHNCTNVYCHSNVQGDNGVGAPTVYKTIQWGANNSLDCGSCHKNMATDASPTGSHLKHANTGSANQALGCGYCHQDGGSGSLNHADNQILVNFTSSIGGTYSNSNRVAGSAAGYGTCSATFCHGAKITPAWGATGSLDCTACHGANSDKTASPGWSGRHTTHYNYSTAPTVYNEALNDLSSAGRYRFNCTYCHDMTSTRHSFSPYSSTAAARVFFGLSSVGTSARRGIYLYGAAQGGTDNGFKYTAGSCNTSYCHSDGKKGSPLVTTLTWTSAPTAGNNCLYCHDGKSTVSTVSKLSPKHDKHMNPANNGLIGTGNGFNCSDCHARTVFKNLSVSNRARHLNGLVDYSGAKAGKNFDATSKVCANVYCHSNGNPNAVVFVSMTGSKAWSGAATITTCNRCHGRSNVLGYPDYANGGANTATANLHPGHLAGMSDTTACADCHRKTGDSVALNKFRPYSTAHLNGAADLSFNGGKTYIGTKASVTTVGYQVTCSQIVCHGQGAPVWGVATTANQCQKCHGSKTTAFQTYTSPQVAPGYGIDGTDTSMSRKLPTDPRVGAHQRHLATSAISTRIMCRECHVPVTDIRSGNHWNYSTATISFNGRGTSNSHTTAGVSRNGNGIMQCSNTWCHTGKSDSGTFATPFWTYTGLVNEGSLTVNSCNRCHGFPPKSVGVNGTALSYDHSALADPTSFPVTICSGCHSNLSKTGTTYADIFVDKTLHVDGTINANSGHAFPYPGASHLSAAGTTPWTACNGCHTTSGNSTYPVVAGIAPDCTGCHKNGLKTPSGTSSCWDCHGGSATDGRPIGNAFPNYSGSHTKHVVNQSMVCSACHGPYGGGVGDTRHGFSNRTAHSIAFVNVTSTTKAFHFTWTGKGTCSNISCHATAEWGVTKLACNSCHSYLASDPWNTTYGVEGVGAHIKHINYLTNRFGITLNAGSDSFGSGNSAVVCGVCHTITVSDHSMNKATNVRNINFSGTTARQFGGSAPFYNGVTGTSSSVNPKSCSNTDCHYLTSPIWSTY